MTARTATTAMRARLRQWATDGLMPFREARALTRPESRRVARIWAVAGACFACLWAAALLLLVRDVSTLAAVAVVAALSALGGVFFGMVALAVVSIFNRAFAAGSASEQSGSAGNRQPLPLDTE